MENIADVDFFTLPFELQVQIISRLNLQEILSLCQVNTSMANLCHDDNFWLFLINERYPTVRYMPNLSSREFFYNLTTKTNIFITNTKGETLYLATNNKKTILGALIGFLMFSLVPSREHIIHLNLGLQPSGLQLRDNVYITSRKEINNLYDYNRNYHVEGPSILIIQPGGKIIPEEAWKSILEEAWGLDFRHVPYVDITPKPGQEEFTFDVKAKNFGQDFSNTIRLVSDHFGKRVKIDS